MSIHGVLSILNVYFKVIIGHRVYIPFLITFMAVSAIVSLLISTINYVDYEANIITRKLVGIGYKYPTLYVLNDSTTCRVKPALCIVGDRLKFNHHSVNVMVAYINVNHYNDKLATILKLRVKAYPDYLSVGYTIAEKLNLARGASVKLSSTGKIYTVKSIHRTNTILDLMVIVFVDKLPEHNGYYLVLEECSSGCNWDSVVTGIIYGLNREIYNAVLKLATHFIILYPLLTLILAYRVVIELKREIKILLMFGSYRACLLLLPLAISIVCFIGLLLGMSMSIMLFDVFTWIARAIGVYLPYKPFLKLNDIIGVTVTPLPLVYASSAIGVLLARRRL